MPNKNIVIIKIFTAGRLVKISYRTRMAVSKNETRPALCTGCSLADSSLNEFKYFPLRPMTELKTTKPKTDRRRKLSPRSKYANSNVVQNLFLLACWFCSGKDRSSLPRLFQFLLPIFYRVWFIQDKTFLAKQKLCSCFFTFDVSFLPAKTVSSSSSSSDSFFLVSV